LLTSRDNTAQLFLLISSIWIIIGLDTLRATGESFLILCVHPNVHCVDSLFMGLLEAKDGELDDITSREITTCLILSNFTNVEFLGK